MTKIPIFLFVFCLAVPLGTNAAEIFFGAHNPSVGIGSVFEVGVFVRTEGQIVNAIEGMITFPSNLLELKEIRDGNSLVNLWVKKPEAQEEVFFSGLVPGGFVGEDGYLFSLFFEAREKGQARIETGAEQILLSDGQGSRAAVKRAPLVLDIVEEGQTVNELAPLDDQDLPESFIPQVARDPSLFAGKWFLVFATQDKNSGIDFYEIREGGGEWKRAKSPYVLEDQELRSDIFVRAVDKAGNERIETLAPQNPAKWYENYLVWVIIIGIVFLCGVTGGIVWRQTRNTKYHE